MIEKILNTMNLQQDKANHAFYGMVIYSFFALYNIHIAIVFTFIVGVGKELYDRYHKEYHTQDVLDAVAVVIVPSVLYIHQIIF